MKKVMLLLVMLFLSSAHAVGEDLEDQHELNYWADWSDGGEQNQASAPDCVDGAPRSPFQTEAASEKERLLPDVARSRALSSRCCVLSEKLPFPFEHFLQRIARRPRPQQFYGLMGKRDAGYSPVSRKRSSEWSALQMFERRRK
ncbi:protachykinin-1 isoform X2 [Ahaetulla prasina]|uniref:protachykinin-1 isoform X2 n=1 Tax=Ahaetulla prasina TaxID=499056 RepID=UPI0026489E75|nr:protachykinin-1 isoform X2 [Ahaetulla prasina]